MAIAGSGRKQKDIARRARIDQWRLSRIVHQDIEPLPLEKTRLARILKTSEAALFEATP